MQKERMDVARKYFMANRIGNKSSVCVCVYVSVGGWAGEYIKCSRGHNIHVFTELEPSYNMSQELNWR
jgi:hypothetical protein